MFGIDIISKNFFKIVEKHINKSMNNALLKLSKKEIAGDIIEYWDTEGNKPVIVLIHGFGATTKYQWFKQVELLSAHYRVILPNLFHFGNSNSTVEKFGVSDQVFLIKTLLDELDIEKVILGGISYGGLVSIEFTKLYPDKVEKLILIDAPIKFMFASDIIQICKVFKVASVENLFVPENARGLKKLWYLSSSKKSYLPAVIFKEFHRKMYVGNKKDKRKLMQSLLNEIDVYAKHEYKIRIPILLIWGSNDMVVPAERGKMLFDYLGDNAELHIIHKGGHMVNLNKPKEFNNILGKFLQL